MQSTWTRALFVALLPALAAPALPAEPGEASTSNFGSDFNNSFSGASDGVTRTLPETRRTRIERLERRRSAKQEAGAQPSPSNAAAKAMPAKTEPNARVDVTGAARTDMSAPEVASPDARPASGMADVQVLFRAAPPPGSESGARSMWEPELQLTGEGVVTLQARVQATNGKGQPVEINPQWVPAHPAAVEVRPDEGTEVTITVRGGGTSNLRLTGSGISKDLWISTRRDGAALSLQITQ
jgi:hypothetical protein